MKKFLIPILVSLILGITSAPVFAVTMELGENVLKNTNIMDDAYILAGNANLKADVYGDLYIGGGSLVIDGDIHEDLVVGGGVITISGNVFGDLRILGGKVAIYGNVGDDIVLAGGQVDVGQNSVVEGSILAGAGILTLDGVVKEDVRGGMGMLFLNGEVDGDVVVTIEDKISIADDAKIGGDLKYSALLEANLPTEAVAGEIHFNKFQRDSVLENLTYVFFIHKILSFFSALLILLLIVIFSPKVLTRSAILTREYVMRSFGIGLLSMITGIVGSLILMFTVIGVSVGLITLAMLMVAMYLTKVFVAAWLTSYFVNYQKKLNRLKFFGALSLSLLVYYLIGLVPYVGWLIDLVLFLIGVGSLILVTYEYLKFLRQKKVV